MTAVMTRADARKMLHLLDRGHFDDVFDEATKRAQWMRAMEVIAGLTAPDPQPVAPAEPAAPSMAQIVRVSRNGAGARTVEIKCPLCGKRHHHSASKDDPYPSHRVAHCATGGGGGYLIPDPDDLDAEQAPQTLAAGSRRNKKHSKGQSN
ncbi:hypothetical protein [Mycobacterium sp. NPDC050853]|uniref:hypothetical protein n=1 Tax=Mycobacterium sp. NPDC050853 TaxID=3155160 RepID=UPI0033DE2485